MLYNRKLLNTESYKYHHQILINEISIIYKIPTLQVHTSKLYICVISTFYWKGHLTSPFYLQKFYLYIFYLSLFTLEQILFYPRILFIYKDAIYRFFFIRLFIEIVLLWSLYIQLEENCYNRLKEKYPGKVVVRSVILCYLEVL